MVKGTPGDWGLGTGHPKGLDRGLGRKVAGTSFPPPGHPATLVQPIFLIPGKFGKFGKFDLHRGSTGRHERRHHGQAAARQDSGHGLLERVSADHRDGARPPLGIPLPGDPRL
jgi:hypothetical protein